MGTVIVLLPVVVLVSKLATPLRPRVCAPSACTTALVALMTWTSFVSLVNGRTSSAANETCQSCAVAERVLAAIARLAGRPAPVRLPDLPDTRPFLPDPWHPRLPAVVHLAEASSTNPGKARASPLTEMLTSAPPSVRFPRPTIRLNANSKSPARISARRDRRFQKRERLLDLCRRRCAESSVW